MADLPFMPVKIPDLLSDAGDLPNALFGAYVRLLFKWWLDGALPEKNEKRLARWAGMSSAEFDDLKEFLTKIDLGWIQKRMMRVYAEQLGKSLKAANSANAKYGKAIAEEELNERIADGYARRGVSHLLRMKDESSIFPDGKIETCADEPKADFEEFWSAYPRRLQDSGGLTRGAKARAKRQWDRLKPDERKAALDGLEGYKRLNPDKSKGVVDAERYLRDARWNDAADAQDGNVPRETFGPLPEPEDETLTERWRALVYAVGPAKARSWLVTAGKPALELNCSGYILRCGGELQKQKIENDMRGTINAVLGKGEWRTEMVETQ